MTNRSTENIKSNNYTDIFDDRGAAYNAAMLRYPMAREAERTQLISLLAPTNHDIICDAPAGGGYMAQGMANMQQNTHDQSSIPAICCVEPSAIFSKAIGNDFEVLNQPLHNIIKPDGHFTVITSLAGLHHADNCKSIFQEWARLLHQNGKLCVADVGTNTGTGQFLNEFVHEHTPNGHIGWFFEKGEFTRLMANNGLNKISESLYTVPWAFKDEQEMAAFCAQLFYLPKVNPNILIEALKDIVGVLDNKDENGILLNWQLRYAIGYKL